MQVFFEEVRKEHLKVRVMFRQNIHHPTNLTEDQIEGRFSGSTISSSSTGSGSCIAQRAVRQRS